LLIAWNREFVTGMEPGPSLGHVKGVFHSTLVLWGRSEELKMNVLPYRRE